jgi:hypothetical protein
VIVMLAMSKRSSRSIRRTRHSSNSKIVPPDFRCKTCRGFHSYSQTHFWFYITLCPTGVRHFLGGGVAKDILRRLRFLRTQLDDISTPKGRPDSCGQTQLLVPIVSTNSNASCRPARVLSGFGSKMAYFYHNAIGLGRQGCSYA